MIQTVRIEMAESFGNLHDLVWLASAMQKRHEPGALLRLVALLLPWMAKVFVINRAMALEGWRSDNLG